MCAFDRDRESMTGSNNDQWASGISQCRGGEIIDVAKVDSFPTHAHTRTPADLGALVHLSFPFTPPLKAESNHQIEHESNRNLRGELPSNQLETFFFHMFPFT